MVGRRSCPIGMIDGYLRGSLTRPATQRQMDVLAAFVAAGGSVQVAAELVGIRPSTVKRHLADLRARSGLTTEQLIYAGRASGRLVVPSLEPQLGRPDGAMRMNDRQFRPTRAAGADGLRAAGRRAADVPTADSPACAHREVRERRRQSHADRE